MDYGWTHDGRVYTPNQTQGLDVATNDERNKAIERAELDAWKDKPDRMLAYFSFPAEASQPRGLRSASWRFSPLLTGAKVTTWLGTAIGVITSARVYQHNFTGRFVALRVQGSNGATYYGRASWDHGTCINLRRAKR